MRARLYHYLELSGVNMLLWVYHSIFKPACPCNSNLGTGCNIRTCMQQYGTQAQQSHRDSLGRLGQAVLLPEVAKRDAP